MELVQLERGLNGRFYRCGPCGQLAGCCYPELLEMISSSRKSA